MLEELGFGLDLESCAATGTNDDLAYVSPKTGRAVSRSAGDPYAGKLLRLPRFLLEPANGDRQTAADFAAAFALTGYFLARHVYEPRGLAIPDARQSFMNLIERAKPAREAARHDVARMERSAIRGSPCGGFRPLVNPAFRSAPCGLRA